MTMAPDPLPSRGGQRGAEMPYTPHDCGEHQPDTTETSR